MTLRNEGNRLRLTTIVHCKREPYDVYCGRPSKWGNPFRIGSDGTRDEVCDKYAEWCCGMREVKGMTPPTVEDAVRELTGKRLGCWCHPARCHMEFWAGVVNAVRTKGVME